MGVPSVPLYLLIADVATKNWCRLTIGLGRSGQLWQVWQHPPGDPTALSIIHCENPISLITISIAPEYFVDPAIAISLLLTWLKSGGSGSDQSGKKRGGHPSLLAQDIIPHHHQT